MSKLLSIVVPTKNRANCLISFAKLVGEMNDPRVEMVIQDNSDDNSEILGFLESNKYENIVYNHTPGYLSVVENCDLAVKNSTGEYVCFMGDDDLISNRLPDFVEYMKAFGYESAVFKPSQYYWPNVKFKAHKFPNLIIKKILPLRKGDKRRARA